MTEESNQLLEEEASFCEFRERFFVLNWKSASVSAVVKRPTETETSHNDQPDSVRAVLTFHKTASRQRVSVRTVRLRKMDVCTFIWEAVLSSPCIS